MEYKPLVSIVTIVYNGEKHLEQTIKSVLDQTYPSIEYIIIDGGSRDSSISIIKKFSDHLAYWSSAKDKGISDAFNKGIKRATGDIIGLINADDWYEKDTVEKIVKAIQNYDIAYGNLQYWKNGKREVVVEGSHHYLQHQMTLNHPTVFVKAECYKKYGNFSLTRKYAMDYDLLLRMQVQDCSFIHVPFVLANMRWEGLSDQKWYSACKEVLDIKKTYIPGNKLSHNFYFIRQVSVIALGKILEKAGLEKFVRFYRSKWSSLRKNYS